jgi:CHASE1-domain containing sensor protein
MRRDVQALAVLLGLPMVLVGAVLFARQSQSRIERAVDQRHTEITQRLDSLSTTLGALAVAQTDNGAADARLFSEVSALIVALRENAARDRARFGLLTAAMGATR